MVWLHRDIQVVVTLQDGNTVVVCTCAAVSSMVTGVLVGLLALGERMPSSRAARAVILASWLAIALGVSGLANGPGECLLMLAPVCFPATPPCQSNMNGRWSCIPSR